MPQLAWLANGPKGFDKYDRAFRRDGDASSSKEQASSEAGAKQKSSSSDEKKSSGNNGGKKNPKKSEFDYTTPMVIGSAILGTVFFGADEQRTGR